MRALKPQLQLGNAFWRGFPEMGSSSEIFSPDMYTHNNANVESHTAKELGNLLVWVSASARLTCTSPLKH